MQNNETKSESAGRFSFYKAPITNKYPCEEITLEEAFERVKSDRYKAAVEKIRSETDKKKQKEIKQAQLDYITARGIFSYCDEDNLRRSSGLADIDLDEINTAEERAKIEEILKNDPYIKAYFRSPSNNFKAFIRVPKDANGDHSIIVKGFYDYLETEYKINKYCKPDTATHNIARACWLSHDPEAVIKTEAKIWETKAEEKEYTPPPNKAMVEDGRLYSEVMETFDNFAYDFLLDYCLKNELPTGERNNVPNKNFAIAVRNRPDREELIKAYCTKQRLETSVIYSWIKDENKTKVNQYEILGYILRNGIKFEIPNALENEKQLMKAVNKAFMNENKDEVTDLIATYFLARNKVYTSRKLPYTDPKNDVWIYRDGIYTPEASSYVVEFVNQIIPDKFKDFYVKMVYNRIRASTFLDDEKEFLKENKEEICIMNGVLNVITKELTPFTPDKIFFNKLPIYYDPDAKCPNIDKFLNSILYPAVDKNENIIPEVEPADKQAIYELFGFLLYKEYFLKKAIMLTGGGDNGKSTIIELIKRFIGSENCSALDLQTVDKEQFAISNLFKKMANISADIPKAALYGTTQFKKLTGKTDEVDADRKNKSRIKFVNYAKMIFSANELPPTKDTTDAFWGRWLIFDFPYQFLSVEEIARRKAENNRLGKSNLNKWFKPIDTKIIDNIVTPEELSGLLNKALEGLARLMKNSDFSHTESARQVEKKWLKKSDSFLYFFGEKCEIDYNATVEKKTLAAEYMKFCREERLIPRSATQIKSTLENKGIWDDRETMGDRARIWVGLKFKGDSPKGTPPAETSQETPPPPPDDQGVLNVENMGMIEG